uniref:uncharacterized protein n=1 Tax=Myxine glutinosa TaxID=7769 RepID=UPI00358E1F74
MSKSFQLVGLERPVPSTSTHPTQTNWKLCIICQEDKAESLTCPSQSKRKDSGSGYSSLAANLIRFSELGQLPGTLQLERLNEGYGIEAAMVANNALYHQTCKLKYNNTKLQRAEKRTLMTGREIHDVPDACKRTRFHSRSSSTEKAQEAQCFFCRQPAGTDGLHEVATFQVDSKVRDWAALLEDTELLGRLSAGDMVAQEAKYHKKCLSVLHNRVRKAQSEGPKYKDEEREVSGIVFAELVLYVEEARLDEETAQVFKLANLVELYQSRMEQLGVKLDTRVHSTRLKQRLLTQFPDMRAHTKGRDILLVFEEDVGAALIKACELDSDNDVVQLARAAQTVRRHMFEEAEPFNGFPEGCQEESVPSLLLALVSMVLEGPSIMDQMADTTPAALAIAQMLKFNCIKHKRAHRTTGPVTARHSAAQETPVPTYEEGGLPRRPCVGSNTATNARAASSNQLGLGQE